MSRNIIGLSVLFFVVVAAMPATEYQKHQTETERAATMKLSPVVGDGIVNLLRRQGRNWGWSHGHGGGYPGGYPGGFPGGYPGGYPGGFPGGFGGFPGNGGFGFGIPFYFFNGTGFQTGFIG